MAPQTTSQVANELDAGRHFAGLLGELCLRAVGISLVIACVIALGLLLVGGTTGVSSS